MQLFFPLNTYSICSFFCGGKTIIEPKHYSNKFLKEKELTKVRTKLQESKSTSNDLKPSKRSTNLLQP